MFQTRTILSNLFIAFLQTHMSCLLLNLISKNKFKNIFYNGDYNFHQIISLSNII